MSQCIDPKLKEWASDLISTRIDLCNQEGTVNGAAKKHGFASRNFRQALQLLKTKAASQGYSPEHDLTNPVPDGFKVKGVSTLYRDGDNVLQWVKTTADQARLEELQAAAIQALNSQIKRTPKTKAPKNTKAELLNAYILTDYHLGMMSWGEETGDDWDMHIAEDLLYNWFSCAIQASPGAEVGLLAQLGDFLHFDGLDALTPAHHNILDADTRFQKIVRVAIRLIRRIVLAMLEKHKYVHIIMAEGNHDPASSIWLREWLHSLYQDEPRVKVDISPDPYYCYEHGSTSLFFHHGHKRKPAGIDDVFVSKNRELFGRTKHSYAHMGHQHHVDIKETNLMIVEQHRTLASKDAYASRGGYMAGRDAKCITYHKKYGEVERITINPEMVKNA